jgi:hypothetical protein
MPMGRSWILGAVTVGSLLVTACGSGQPDSFAKRDKLPGCGELPDGHISAPLSVVEKEALACMRSAAKSGRAAELSYAFLTTEGDPIRYWLRVRVGGSVEMFEYSKDSFGPSGWTYFASCDIAVAELVALPSPDACGRGSKA